MTEDERFALMRELVTEAGMSQPELWHKATEQAFARSLVYLFARIKEIASQSWREIAAAPENTRLIVFGKGGTRFAVCDDDGQWRNMMGRPLDVQPTHWMPIPPPPRAEEK